ncbi:MAG TPA: twin-arginine translocase TatA/TatE family subunit [Gammaproteobacteria bacterium]|nr:twin-arginine translocase TatA/TatE family subunit [Gammaproteobacteria bacterium]
MELSVGKILLILVIVVLVFGTARLPKIGEDIGRAVRSFKKGVHTGDDETGATARPADDKPQSGSGNSSH